MGLVKLALILKKKSTWLLVLVLVLVITVIGFFVSRAHHRVITQGSFMGIEIGQSKEDVFRVLVTKPKVLSVFPVQYEDYKVISRNISEILGLIDHEGAIVSGPHTNLYVFQRDGIVTKILRGDTGWQMRSISVGDPWETALREIKGFILAGSKRAAYATLRDYDEVSTSDGLSVLQSSEYTNLAERNRWAFKKRGKWTITYLFFVDGKLTKIDYTNNFTELP